MKKYLLISLLALSIADIFAQNETTSATDSLKHALVMATEDSTRILVYHNLANALAEKQTDEALTYSKLALAIAQKINTAEFLVQAYTNLGAIHRRRSDYRKALSNFAQAIALRPSLDDENSLSAGCGYAVVLYDPCE